MMILPSMMVSMILLKHFLSPLFRTTRSPKHFSPHLFINHMVSPYWLAQHCSVLSNHSCTLSYALDIRASKTLPNILTLKMAKAVFAKILEMLQQFMWCILRSQNHTVWEIIVIFFLFSECLKCIPKHECELHEILLL
jgi:hypothetical protein